MEVKLLDGFENVVFRPSDDPTSVWVDNGLGGGVESCGDDCEVGGGD
jgi:hypothetical protein